MFASIIKAKFDPSMEVFHYQLWEEKISYQQKQHELSSHVNLLCAKPGSDNGENLGQPIPWLSSALSPLGTSRQSQPQCWHLPDAAAALDMLHLQLMFSIPPAIISSSSSTRTTRTRGYACLSFFLFSPFFPVQDHTKFPPVLREILQINDKQDQPTTNNALVKKITKWKMSLWLIQTDSSFF